MTRGIPWVYLFAAPDSFGDFSFVPMTMSNETGLPGFFVVYNSYRDFFYRRNEEQLTMTLPYNSFK